MPAKINFISLNEPLWQRNIRRISLLPAGDFFYRAKNRIFKKLQGGLPAFPQNMHIEVTNHCNLTCPMCLFPKQTRPKGFMEFGLFEKIIKQCAGKNTLEKMALMGLGEPFLHPELIAMSRYAKAHNIFHVFTSTNATLLGEEDAKAIIKEPGLDLLAISLDGASKKTYEDIRRGADFDKVTGNVINFIKIRKSLKKRRPSLVLQFLVMRKNYAEKEAFIKFWQEKLDAQDIISIRDVDTFGGQAEDHRLPSQIPSMRRKPCLQLWRDLSVSWNGEVTVCCKDVNYLLKAGNIKEEPLEEVWNNSLWQRLRSLHKQGCWQEIGLCASCNEWGS